ncbi:MULTISPECIES: class I SAM-dependent methyltransferase [unclassified Nocardiopsis]|uniref:class I SAM-dependent methyltransferase n=1 Tax=unclassified Nocardiopsis TaxID=2649073 RepID=UPI00135C6A88|nr:MULTISPECIES: methyltransferase domain-containing protein [unclassified Nocardiopsis]
MTERPLPAPGPDAVKSCCAAAYGTDAVALLLGESYHPGGLALTRRLADSLAPAPGARVLDVASGPGTTARLLAAEYGARVDGVDLGPATVATARAVTERAGLADRVRFHEGDAERLPFAAGTFDALVCECALCTFPDKEAAAAEFARVLRPGGRVGITDVTVAEGGLPEELAGIAGWVSCIADARSEEGYRALLEQAGLRVRRAERHVTAIARMVEQIDARLRLLGMTAPERLAEAGVDARALTPYLEAARAAVADGTVGYSLLLADKPGSAGS